MEGLVEDLTRGQRHRGQGGARLDRRRARLLPGGDDGGGLRQGAPVLPLGWPRRRAPTAPTGDAIVAVTIVVAIMCVSYFELEDDYLLHVVSAIALLSVLALKIAVVRWGLGLSRLLPVLGVSVWALFALTWATSAGDFLGDALMRVR